MTLKAFVGGLQSLRPMTPGLIFLAAALALVLLPRRWSCQAAGGSAIIAALFAALAAALSSGTHVSEQSDFFNDRLATATPFWVAAVVPALVGCLQRRDDPTRGLVIAGILLAAGGLCFAAAAKTLSLFLTALALALAGTGAAVISAAPTGDGRDGSSDRFAGRFAFASFFFWVLLTAGVALVFRERPFNDLGALRTVDRESPSRLVGAMFVTVALFGFLGCVPLSAWFRGGRPATESVSTALLTLVGLVAYLKLGRMAHSFQLAPVIWAWSLASALLHLTNLFKRNLRHLVSAQLALLGSVAAAFLALDDGRDHWSSTTGAVALLLSASLGGPTAAAAVEACELNISGAMGRPAGARSLALGASLWVLIGLPLSLAFWGWLLVAASAIIPGRFVGVRQVTAAVACISILVFGAVSLRHLAGLRSRPRLPPLDEDGGWRLIWILYGTIVLVGVGCTPGPVLRSLSEIAQSAMGEMPPALLKP